MSTSHLLCRAISIVVWSAVVSLGDIQVVFEHNDNASAGPAFRFKNVPPPMRGDAAAKATFALVDGVMDRNSGGPERLNDGRLPAEEDQPAENFFFNAGTDGGRLQLDLGGIIEIKRVSSYSWHSSDRGPQVYRLYASDGTDEKFEGRPKGGSDPAQSGWKLIASVDTRPASGERGGQYGVNIFNADGSLGRYRYLLFVCSETESDDPFGNTFYSEIDVVDANAPPTEEPLAAQPTEPIQRTFTAADGKYQFAMDLTLAPDLAEWAEKELQPVVQGWYPKIVAMLPSEGFEAPARVTIVFRDNMGGTPASAGGNRINCNIGWFRRNLKGEAVGSVVHEMVHIVQQYGRARRNNPNATRTPGWVTEGIPDYIRWFLYEPQSKGAEITARNFSRARYDGNYRITANFLNWVIEKYDQDLHVKLNAAARESRYREELWKQYTGKTLQELGDEWREAHRVRLGLPPESNGANSGAN